MGSNTPVLVLSDHVNLRYFTSAQNLTARQARWESYLRDFNFNILHLAGKLNPADPASRTSNYSEGKDLSDKVVLLGYREDLENKQKGLTVSVIRIKNADIKSRLDPSTLFMPADTSTSVALKSLHDSDELIQGKASSFLTFYDGFWWWRDRIFVPKAMRDLVLKQYHESPAAGHWGSMKTLDMLMRTFGWPNMRQDTLDFIKKCKSCQVVKVDH